MEDTSPGDALCTYLVTVFRLAVTASIKAKEINIVYIVLPRRNDAVTTALLEIVKEKRN